MAINGDNEENPMREFICALFSALVPKTNGAVSNNEVVALFREYGAVQD